MKSALEAAGFPYPLHKINPRKDARYSSNLYRWLGGRRGKVMGFWHVYKIAGKPFIGSLDRHGGFVGSRLTRVLCEGGHADIVVEAGVLPSQEVKTFWARYLRLGKCVLDPKHVDYHSGRYDYDAKESRRTCRFCKKTFKRVVKRKRIVVEEVAWVC